MDTVLAQRTTLHGRCSARQIVRLQILLPIARKAGRVRHRRSDAPART
ncbi:hypothetical protein LL965_12485 [Xanthomonas cassavae CFBP 4642]|uniref:Uncharacterized protein n=1 Tax=Xanthomonas cassavae CFBP 4642 TaxID=1219375 RepID=A0ABS8HFB1_9XANT|nr:hypothetical protein [Xanthomonas cassavae]MCC4620866.1 hypothetical protein [Xanthomonas cassavae CFBP 4642]